MAAFIQRFPFFDLIQTEHQAEVAIESLACFASIEEREHLLPLIVNMQKHLPHVSNTVTLADMVNNLLAGYLAMYGELTDRLLIMLSEDLANAGISAPAANEEATLQCA